MHMASRKVVLLVCVISVLASIQLLVLLSWVSQ